MKKRLLGVLFVALGTLLGAFLLCFANPMLLIFLQRVGITNASAEDVHAVPLGRGEDGQPMGPPLFWTELPVALPRFDREFVIKAGEATSFVYDWDDINLCWLLVRSASSGWKVVPSSLDGGACSLALDAGGGCCRGLEADFRFRVDSVSTLPDAPSWMVDVICPDGGSC